MLCYLHPIVKQISMGRGCVKMRRSQDTRGPPGCVPVLRHRQMFRDVSRILVRGCCDLFHALVCKPGDGAVLVSDS